MRIARGNAVKSASVSLLDGTLESSDLDAMLDADFSNGTLIRGSASGIQFEISNSRKLDYVWFGGTDVMEGSGFIDLTIEVSCGAYIETITSRPERGVWFDMSSVNPNDDIAVTVSVGSAVTVNFGVIMAGRSAEVPNGGVVGGQPLPPLQYNRKVRNNTDIYGNPTTQITRRVNPKANWNIPNILLEDNPQETGFREHLEEFHDLLSEFGLAPVYDDVSQRGYETYAVYAVTKSSFTRQSSTNKLVKWSLSGMGAY